MKSLTFLVLSFLVLNLHSASAEVAIELNESELEIFQKCVASLPLHLRRINEAKIDRIEFHEYFDSWAAFELALNKETEKFEHIYHFRRDLLHTPLHEVIQNKEKSYFVELPDYGIKLNTCYDLPAFGYALAHEMAHVFQFYFQLENTPENNPHWIAHALPRKEYDFDYRSDIKPYQEAIIPFSQAPQVYLNLSKSPFTTLYGATTLNEDFAELAALHYVTRHLGHKFVLEVFSQDGAVVRHEPSKNPLIERRLNRFEEQIKLLPEPNKDFDPFAKQKSILRKELEQDGAGQRR